MWLSQVLHPPNCVGKYFLRRVPYRPITLLYQGTAGQSPQGFPRSALPLRPAHPDYSSTFDNYWQTPGLLSDSFVISHFHYSHRDRIPIDLQDSVCALPRHLRLKTSPRISPRISPLHVYNALVSLHIQGLHTRPSAPDLLKGIVAAAYCSVC